MNARSRLKIRARKLPVRERGEFMGRMREIVASLDWTRLPRTFRPRGGNP